ncbi:type II toxin-antitoxin system RelE/ParE family toxin [Desulfobacterota bacterium M19]
MAAGNGKLPHPGSYLVFIILAQFDVNDTLKGREVRKINMVALADCNTMSYSSCMQKLSTKWFKKWSQKAKLDNHKMLEAIADLENGLSVAELGGNLYKVRVSRAGKGKSSGFRTIVVYRKDDRIIFLYGFGKNEKENIDKTELHYFKKLGEDLLSLNLVQLKQYLNQGILFNLEIKS